jgi:hypothetical protein
MSQAYKVAQAFQATVSKEDKTPKVVEFDGHTFNAWKVKLDGHSDKGWINVNKKPGNEITAGDELYGDINQVDGKFGTFYNFKSASRPLGDAPAPSQAASAPTTTAQQGELDELTQDKLDYIIGMLEQLNSPELANVQKVIPGAKAAVDLDDLDI